MSMNALHAVLLLNTVSVLPRRSVIPDRDIMQKTMKQKIPLNSFSPTDKEYIEPKQDDFRKIYQELTMLTYLQSIIMSMFPCFKLADFLSEKRFKRNNY